MKIRKGEKEAQGVMRPDQPSPATRFQGTLLIFDVSWLFPFLSRYHLTLPQGNFIGVSLLNRKRDARIALAKTMKRLDQEKEAYLLLPIDEEDDDDDFPRFDNEFVRK